MDLWLDDSIYPRDPPSSQSPCFFGLMSFFKFVCVSENGLLGYCKRLFAHCQSNIHCRFEKLLTKRDTRIKMLEGCNLHLASITRAIENAYQEKVKLSLYFEKEIKLLQQIVHELQAKFAEKDDSLACLHSENIILDCNAENFRK